MNAAALMDWEDNGNGTEEIAVTEAMVPAALMHMKQCGYCGASLPKIFWGFAAKVRWLQSSKVLQCSMSNGTLALAPAALLEEQTVQAAARVSIRLGMVRRRKRKRKTVKDEKSLGKKKKK